jgi:hypothetical protein
MSALYRNLSALFAGLAAVLFLGQAAALAQGVNGRNVTIVNTATGVFELSPGKVWTERGADGATFTFAEQNRDDWSVYLFDASRSVNLQLDLHRRQIFYSDPNSSQRPLYAITGRSAVVNGRNVIQANMQAGRLIMTDNGAWVEQGNDGATFNFVEDGRDDWSVYLSDASRGVRLQIDIHRKLVLYADQGAPNMRPLYPITSASAIGN